MGFDFFATILRVGPYNIIYGFTLQPYRNGSWNVYTGDLFIITSKWSQTPLNPKLFLYPISYLAKNFNTITALLT